MEWCPSWLARILYFVVGMQYVSSGRASLDFPSIGAGLQAQLTITATGALLGDYCELGCETAEEAGLASVAKVTANDTVTVTVINNTAGAIDPAAKNYTTTVLRRMR